MDFFQIFRTKLVLTTSLYFLTESMIFLICLRLALPKLCWCITKNIFKYLTCSVEYSWHFFTVTKTLALIGTILRLRSYEPKKPFQVELSVRVQIQNKNLSLDQNQKRSLDPIFFEGEGDFFRNYVLVFRTDLYLVFRLITNSPFTSYSIKTLTRQNKNQLNKIKSD